MSAYTSKAEFLGKWLGGAGLENADCDQRRRSLVSGTDH
jgi:hypothetical protein